MEYEESPNHFTTGPFQKTPRFLTTACSRLTPRASRRTTTTPAILEQCKLIRTTHHATHPHPTLALGPKPQLQQHSSRQSRCPEQYARRAHQQTKKSVAHISKYTSAHHSTAKSESTHCFNTHCPAAKHNRIQPQHGGKPLEPFSSHLHIHKA